MKTEDKIILYLDNRMSEDEKSIFEKEIESSSALKDEVDRCKKIFTELNKIKAVKVNEEYFVEMIPKFRGRLELKRRLRFLPRLAFGMTTVAAVLVVLFFTINRNFQSPSSALKTNGVQSSGTEIITDFNSLSDQLNIGSLNQEEVSNSNTVLDSLLYSELSLTPQSLSEISSDNNQDLNSVVQGINQKEADEIYNQLLHKKIY